MIEKRTSTVTHPRRLAAGLALLAALPLPGCWGYSQARPVDAPRAREALKIALDHWKKGEDPRSLPSSGTPMVAHDYEWDSGAKLVDYHVVDDSKEEDANLRVQVKLTLSNPGKDKGKPVEKNAWYVVGTSPSVTVYRDMMRR
jgi:hypothetical protein